MPASIRRSVIDSVAAKPRRLSLPVGFGISGTIRIWLGTLKPAKRLRANFCSLVASVLARG